MRFVRQYRFVLLFFLLLIFCSVMWMRQREAADKKHVEIREAFILLHTRSYTNEARKLYQRLLMEMPGVKDRQLFDDFQRTLMLVDPDPHSQQTNNLIWSYHWTVSNEIERREEDTLRRAHKLAAEE